MRGSLVLHGFTTGPVPPFDLQHLALLGSMSVTRTDIAHSTRDAPS